MRDGRRRLIGRKRKPSYPSNSDSVELRIQLRLPFWFTLERKAPYASDSDSASDYVTSGNQALRYGSRRFKWMNNKNRRRDPHLEKLHSETKSKESYQNKHLFSSLFWFPEILERINNNVVERHLAMFRLFIHSWHGSVFCDQHY